MTTLAGFMFGSLLCGAFADMFGRKKVVVWFNFLHTIVGFFILLTNSFPLLILIRFLGTSLSIALCYSSYTWSVENVGRHRRALAGLTTSLGWVLGMLVLSLLAYFLRDWRLLTIAISVLAVPLLSLPWIIHESPRWLLYKGRTDEAIEVLNKIAKVNNNASSLSEETINSSIKALKAERHDSFRKQLSILLKSKTLVIRTVILVVNWMVLSCMYYGFSLNIGSIIEGDLYLNFFIMNILELLMIVTCIFVLSKIGRKRWYCTCMFISALACLSTIIPIFLETDEKWIHSALSNIGKFTIAGAFGTIAVFTGELYPTSIRNSGVGFCSFMARVGSIFSPVIGNLNVLVGGRLGNALPMVIFGSLTFIAALLALYLPETRGKHLTDRLRQDHEEVDDASNLHVIKPL